MSLRKSTLLAAVLLAANFLHAQDKDLTIENETLAVKWSAASHQLSLVDKSSGREFLNGITLNGEGGTATLMSVTSKTFGDTRVIEISHSNGNQDIVGLAPGLPFALIRSYEATRQNAGSVLSSVKTFSGRVALGKPAAELKTLGTGGLLAPDKNPGSYLWLTVVEPQSRNGVVFGWLTSERGSGVLFSQITNGTVQVDARLDYGRLHVGQVQESLETLVVGYFADARFGLEAYADAIAKVQNIHLPPQPTVYCTWYSESFGGSSDEKHFAENAAFAKTNLAPFGLSVMQIDDGWQSGLKHTNPGSPKKDFTKSDPDGPYPGGMKVTADAVKNLGLTPGIWFMPFAGTADDPYFTNHLDWFVKTANGEPFVTPWGGASLDMTYGPARAHVADVVNRITHDWGFQYIKIDGLWTGTATQQRYINAGYTNDNIGDAVFHDPNVPNIAAYRSGLKLVRDVAGTNVFILGCCIPQNMRSYGPAMGMVDAMRIGPDNKADWDAMLRGPTFGSRHYFLNGRVWYNDPDPIYVRDSVPLNEARALCSWVTISGAMNTSSEWYPGLSPERLELLRETMPGRELLTDRRWLPARPVDLFENDPPQVWLLTEFRLPMITGNAGKTANVIRNVVGLFNWGDSDKEFDYPLGKIGLDTNLEYVAFDYWQNQLLPAFKGDLKISVPARSCCVLAVRPVADHPQLISTSRHITQGIVDVLAEKWDGAAKALSGRSKVVGGDDYELRIVGGAAVSAAEVSPEDKAAGVEISFAQNGQLARVKIQSPASREVSWSVGFK